MRLPGDRKGFSDTGFGVNGIRFPRQEQCTLQSTGFALPPPFTRPIEHLLRFIQGYCALVEAPGFQRCLAQQGQEIGRKQFGAEPSMTFDPFSEILDRVTTGPGDRHAPPLHDLPDAGPVGKPSLS